MGQPANLFPPRPWSRFLWWELDARPSDPGQVGHLSFSISKEAGSTPNLESAPSRLPPHDLAFFPSEDPRELLFLFPCLLPCHSTLEYGLMRQGWVRWGLTWAQRRTSPGRGRWLRRRINRHTHLQQEKPPLPLRAFSASPLRLASSWSEHQERFSGQNKGWRYYHCSWRRSQSSFSRPFPAFRHPTSALTDTVAAKL